MTDATAEKLIKANVQPEARSDKLIEESGGSAAAAYYKWLNGYARSTIVPGIFRDHKKK